MVISRISVAESQTFLFAELPQRRGARRNGCFCRLVSTLSQYELVLMCACMVNV